MLNLKTKFIMPPIKTGFCSKEGFVTDKFIDLYKRRSKFLGAIIPEPLCIDRSLRELPMQVCIDNDDKIEGLSKLTSSIHEHDTKVIAHINHPGRMAKPKIPNNVYLSSTDKACENGGKKKKKMDREDMDHAKNLLVAAAKRAEISGFDALEMQFGHGYLFAQFISPAVNDRDDDYGGSFENRIKYPVEVLREVRNSVDLPIIARISAEEMIPNGIKIDEMIEFSKILEKEGVAAIHVSIGTICSTPPWFFQHMFVPKGKTWQMAGEIQKHINIPVIYVGKINTKDDIEKLTKEHNAQYMAVGRALLADPDFIGKYLGEIDGNARPCMACSDGCLGGVRSGEGLKCVVNPLLGNEDHDLGKTDMPMKIAVVGGGLAGMEAAVTLTKRGHNVDIYEKNELGGQFNLAYLPPNKGSLKLIVDYYKNEIERYASNTIISEVDAKMLIDKNYDKVIIATGAHPAIPPIEGLSEYYWAEVLQPHNIPHGKKFLVIGGGLIGMEVTSMLLDNDNEVIVVEMLDEAARGMEMIEKAFTMKKINQKNVKVYLNTKVTKIDGKKCTLVGENSLIIDDVDHIIIAAGMKSYDPLSKELEGKLDHLVIGDAKKPAKAIDAIRDAYFETMNM